MAELVFEVVQEIDGGYCAECLTENIFTQGDTWEELRRNVIEATSASSHGNSPQLFLDAADFILHMLFAVGAGAETQVELMRGAPMAWTTSWQRLMAANTSSHSPSMLVP
jgi:hypothetical protein